MASAIATNRLRKELQKIQIDPPPGIIAEPKESNILVWFYALRGPTETPFEGGIYVGKLKFPSEYPMKAPDIFMLTPSGRFEINKKLCLSMSSFHQESWSPSWSVSSIIQGIQSFMASSELTTGGIQSPDSHRKQLAEQSIEYNRKNFPDLFGGNMEEAFARADEARRAAEEKALATTARKPQTKEPKRAVNVGPKPCEEENLSSDDEGGEEYSSPTLTADEIEKRRKKNAKKREKAKAKTMAMANKTAVG
jgi:ubiquitin-conjugating enzyme E2 J2